MILVIKDLTPVKLFCDNESTIKLGLNPIFHERTKHFKIYVDFVKEKIENGIVKVIKIDSLIQNDDILTKSLTSLQHDFLSKDLGL